MIFEQDLRSVGIVFSLQKSKKQEIF